MTEEQKQEKITSILEYMAEKKRAVGRGRMRKWRAANPRPKKTRKRRYSPEIALQRRRASVVAWNKTNSDKKKNSHLLRTFGITLEQRNAMLAAQGGVCAICGRDNPGWNGDWHTDHVDNPDGTKTLRRILCNFCNPGLGLFRDNPDLLRRAAGYLETWGFRCEAVAA